MLDRAEADAADAEWIGLYGQDAFDRALEATHWVLQLDYPPPPDPRSSGVRREDDPLDDCDLVVQAAWGPPRMWPAHMFAGLSQVQLAQARLQAAHKAAVDTARWADP